MTRAAAILDALEVAGGEPLGVSDLARSLGIAKSSTSHLCQALEDARIIQRRENGYVLGRRTVELAGAYLAGFDEVRSFYELCSRTVSLRDHVVQIALLDGTDVLYLARYEGRSRFRLAANIGERFPAALTATGQALLAVLPPAEVTRRFRGVEIPHMTDASLSGVAALQARLAKARADGYAFDDEGVHPGVIGMAVRLTPRQAGGPMLSLGVTVLKNLATESMREKLLGELKSVAAALSNPLIFG
ncbi:IclR family transcriptional regulator [Kribbella sp. NPDC050470]|uniref:IclR family transcriptional regulator n=1 Tax=unclassified Kribbella TaxID=2644121 RepID=UPI00378F232E